MLLSKEIRWAEALHFYSACDEISLRIGSSLDADVIREAISSASHMCVRPPASAAGRGGVGDRSRTSDNQPGSAHSFVVVCHPEFRMM